MQSLHTLFNTSNSKCIDSSGKVVYKKWRFSLEPCHIITSSEEETASSALVLHKMISEKASTHVLVMADFIIEGPYNLASFFIFGHVYENEFLKIIDNNLVSFTVKGLY